MKNVLIVGPFEPYGRFSGGISSILKVLEKKETEFRHYGFNIRCLNSCFLFRSPKSHGRLTFRNVRNFVIYKRMVFRELKTNHADYLYLHTSVGLPLLKDLLIAKKAIKKMHVIIHIHSADIDSILTTNWLIRKIILFMLKHNATKIALLSSKTLCDFNRQGIPMGKMFVVPNFSSIKTDCFINRSSVNRLSPVNLLFLGSIETKKGIFDLLEALAATSSNVHLKIGGLFNEQGAEKRFYSLLAQCGDKAEYMGYLSGDEKKTALKNADVCVLPSYTEGVPICILEGMSFGEAILASRVGAIPEIVDETNGILFSSGDQESILKAFSFFDLHRELLLSMQKYSYQKSKLYTPSEFIRKICYEIDE